MSLAVYFLRLRCIEGPDQRLVLRTRALHRDRLLLTAVGIHDCLRGALRRYFPSAAATMANTKKTTTITTTTRTHLGCRDFRLDETTRPRGLRDLRDFFAMTTILPRSVRADLVLIFAMGCSQNFD